MWKAISLMTAGASILVVGCSSATVAPSPDAPVMLPAPETDGDRSLEEILAARRSVRTYADRSLTSAEVGQLLWAAQGVSDEQGRRTAPSAGGRYPLELYVADAEGTARYVPAEHALAMVSDRDLRAALAEASGQEAVGEAPVVFVLTGVAERTEERYGSRAERYVLLEAGHAAQNLLLQATALGLGGVPIGSFDDASVARILGLAEGERPIYLLPVGHPGGS